MPLLSDICQEKVFMGIVEEQEESIREYYIKRADQLAGIIEANGYTYGGSDVVLNARRAFGVTSRVQKKTEETPTLTATPKAA